MQQSLLQTSLVYSATTTIRILTIFTHIYFYIFITILYIKVMKYLQSLQMHLNTKIRKLTLKVDRNPCASYIYFSSNYCSSIKSNFNLLNKASLKFFQLLNYKKVNFLQVCFSLAIYINIKQGFLKPVQSIRLWLFSEF